MQIVSYRRHRFHPNIIKQAVWLYFRFTMSYRDVEDLLAERGIDVSSGAGLQQDPADGARAEGRPEVAAQAITHGPAGSVKLTPGRE